MALCKRCQADSGRGRTAMHHNARPPSKTTEQTGSDSLRMRIQYVFTGSVRNVSLESMKSRKMMYEEDFIYCYRCKEAYLSIPYTVLKMVPHAGV